MAKILIVEDDPAILSMLKETMEQEGFETLTATNGLQAMDTYDSIGADVIITDILMPEKEGLSLITDLKKKNPNIHIIAISGGAPSLSPECNLDLARMFGAAHTFAKPLDIDALVRTIQEILA